MNHTLWRSLLIFCFLLTAGCTVQPKVALEYRPPPATDTPNRPAVAINVEDERPCVTSGEKPAAYVGTFRWGSGNPFNVIIKKDVTLAQLLHDDLVEELKTLGFMQPHGNKQLRVTVKRWEFDAYQNAGFNYALNVKVLGETQTLLAESEVTDSIFIRGTFWGGGKAGVARDMPKLYAEVIRKIVRENPKILRALQ